MLKYIQQITSLINECASHTKLMHMQTQMVDVFQEAADHHESLMQLIDENDENFDVSWIDDLKFYKETCISNTNEYLHEVNPINVARLDADVHPSTQQTFNVGKGQCKNILSSAVVSNFDRNPQLLHRSKSADVKFDINTTIHSPQVAVSNVYWISSV